MAPGCHWDDTWLALGWHQVGWSWDGHAWQRYAPTETLGVRDPRAICPLGEDGCSPACLAVPFAGFLGRKAERTAGKWAPGQRPTHCHRRRAPISRSPRTTPCCGTPITPYKTLVQLTEMHHQFYLVRNWGLCLKMHFLFLLDFYHKENACCVKTHVVL